MCRGCDWIYRFYTTVLAFFIGQERVHHGRQARWLRIMWHDMAMEALWM